MSNRRQLKKYVHAVCDGLSAEISIASLAFPEINTEEVNAILNDIAALQVDTLSKVSVAFDKSKAEAPEEYTKARRTYFRQAYGKLHEEFVNGVEEIVKRMNAALPEDVRSSFKEAAKED